MAAPVYSATDQETIAAGVQRFLERGGRVLTTGPTGTLLLPGGKMNPPTTFMTEECHTNPGDGPLAAAGRVAIADQGSWAGKQKAEVAHRCGPDAVVVSMRVGGGEAVWWSSAVPLTNAELKTDADLRLLLLSLGDGRTILWDESLHETVPGLWDAARGLPIWWLIAQVVLLAVLLVLSFSRRNGPLRSPVTVPRSSPVEFASSMGDLYEKARATTAATDAARRRLLRAIVRDAGVPQAIVDDGPQAIVSALTERLGGEWRTVGVHLQRANDAAKESPTYREALAISRTLAKDAERIRAAVRVGGRAVRPVRVA
jgi:DNA-binding transcriptional ArsR family regulator